MAPHMFEPFFNGALLAYKLGDFQESTSQDFGAHGEGSQWCVCLHLYKSWGGGGGDTSQCSAAAMSASA